MERKFERSVEQDKPLGSIGDRSRPKETTLNESSITEKAKLKEKQ
ncbi:MAG: hypothetical protein WBA16_05165 [Nonlabens sp.]